LRERAASGEQVAKLGVAVDEGGDVGAGGDDTEFVPAGVGEGGAHEVLGEAASAEFGRDERVRADQAVRFERVVGVREMAVEGEDEAAIGFIVLHGGLRRRGHGVGTTVKSPVAGLSVKLVK